MEVLILISAWIAAVLVVDLIVIRPWRSAEARSSLPILLAAIVAAWVIGTGAYTFSHMMADGSWTAATIAMPIVPIKAIVLSLAAYAAGRTFQSARASAIPQQWVLPVILAAFVGYAMVSDVLALRAGALERHAASPTLTPVEVAALAQRVKGGDAGRSETYSFLSNPQCPPELSAQYAASEDAFFRTAVASNPKIDAALADKLAADSDETVRTYLAGNRTLPPAILTRLAADPSERVRDIVAGTEALPGDAFNRLVEDPSPRVRATAALQERRLSPEQLEKLQNDPEERVRDAAYRWGARTE